MSTYRTVTVKATFQNDTISPKADFKNNIIKEASFGMRSPDILPSDDLPLMDGEASPGVGRKFSRSDHRHPHDSDKLDYMSAITNLELEAMLR